jgi:hypothetical protein
MKQLGQGLLQLSFFISDSLIFQWGVDHKFCLARYQKKVSNIIDDVLEWSPKLALSGKQSEVLVTQNDTNVNMSSDSGVNQSSPPRGDLDDASPLEGDLNVDSHVIPDKFDGAEPSSDGPHIPSSTIEDQ